MRIALWQRIGAWSCAIGWIVTHAKTYSVDTNADQHRPQFGRHVCLANSISVQ